MTLSTGWSFVRRRAPASWLAAPSGEEIDLPHCWNMQDAFQRGVAYYRGPGSYGRTVRLDDQAPRDGVRWFLVSGGFYGTGDVWLNGRRVARVDGQYLGIRLDVTDHLHTPGDNVLAFRLTNRCRSHVLPGISDPDFLLYGGLSCDLRLEATPTLCLAEQAACIRTHVDQNSADVRVACPIVNASDRSAACSVTTTIRRAGSTIARESVKADARAGQEHEAVIDLRIEQPDRWDTDSPALYEAEICLTASGYLVDTVRISFGVREAIFRPAEGFFLNGRRLALHGVNRHECLPGFGRALPPELHHADARLLKSLGANFVRLSHYPQHPAFLDACDAQGILIYAELASWKSVRTGRWLQSAMAQMAGMIRRDRNHPSVILWGMGNESRSRKAFASLGNLVQELDPTRPTIYAENHLYRARRYGTVGMPDVWGLNYEVDVLDEVVEAARLRNVVVSECCNAPDAQRGEPDAELSQVDQLEAFLPVLARNPATAGYALWCFNDYATLRKGRYLRYSGLVDAFRVPKMGASRFRAEHATTPFVALHAEWGRAGPAKRRVHVFTNCETVEIACRGDVLFREAHCRHATQDITWQNAPLVATARMDGAVVSDRLEPHGDACALRITVPPVSEGSATPVTLPIDVEAVDAEGHRATDWTGTARLTVSPPAILRAFTAADEIPIAAGHGRTYMVCPSSAAEVLIHATAPTLSDTHTSISPCHNPPP